MQDPGLVTQFTGAAMIVWIIQGLKNAGWFPHMTVDTVKVNRFISALAALATASALHWNWDATTASLTISGLTVINVTHFAWAAAQQFVGQEMIYQLIYAPKTVIQQIAAQREETIQDATHEVVHAIVETKGEQKP